MSKRHNRRVPCSAIVTIGSRRGRCKNISVGGMFFLGAALPLKSMVEVRFKAMQITAEVRYHYTYPEGVGSGLRFIRLQDKELQAIREFILN